MTTATAPPNEQHVTRDTAGRRVVRPLTYAERCERYARQRGWKYDEHAMSIGHLTPRQRRRALRKERHAWPLAAVRGDA